MVYTKIIRGCACSDFCYHAWNLPITLTCSKIRAFLGALGVVGGYEQNAPNVIAVSASFLIVFISIWEKVYTTQR